MKYDKVLVTGAGGLMGRYITAELDGHCRVHGFDIAPGAGALPHTVASIEDHAAVSRAVAGMDAVVHVAARPNIWSGDGSQIMHTNTVGTWNVLDAAERAGVRRVVITSSDSVVGFTVAEGAMIPPDYLPVDLDHPLRPTDPYALSKKLCEAIARSFVDRGLEVTVIRPVFVLYPEFEAEVKARAADPAGYRWPIAGGRQPPGGGPAWHYVDPRDLARAFRLALEADPVRFGPFFICGPTTLAPEPTVDRLAGRMGRRIPVKAPEVYAANPFAPLYDLSPARDELGFVAEHDMRALLYG